MESPAQRFNRECDCSVTDLPTLRRRLDAVTNAAQPIVATHPHLFSESPVFLDAAHVATMQDIIRGVEAVSQLPGYRQATLDDAPAIARVAPRTSSVFMGFDFHITADGPKLIEINTNAGGAFLNAAAREAQRACCNGANDSLTDAAAGHLEDQLFAMFTREWTLARGPAPLRTIAIVDESPHTQYLYPEFRLAQRLFESRGVRAHIADPSELTLEGGALRLRGETIDLVYNRLTDFYFEAPHNSTLRTAYERDLAVITPHPHAHALFANKRNLTLLSSAATLGELRAPPEVIATLVKGIPTTRAVCGADETWWRDRKAWFFKPHSGFGSRGAYRGDKLTRRVFAEIANGDYIAQEYAPPSERRRSVNGLSQAFKMDVRCYVYAGRIQLMAARLYQGQTTNFRTEGGGFAPVYVPRSSTR